MSRTPEQKRVSRELNAAVESDLRLRYVERGLSLETIADKYGVTKPTVARWLNALGIPCRPVGRPRKAVA